MACIRFVPIYFIFSFFLVLPAQIDAMEAGDQLDEISLGDLLNLDVEVASLFMEDEQVVGSTVSAIGSGQ